MRVNDEICRINKSIFPKLSSVCDVNSFRRAREWIFERVDDVIIIGGTLSPVLFFYFPFPRGDGEGEIKKAIVPPRDVDQEKTISDLITIKEALLVFIGTDLK